MDINGISSWRNYWVIDPDPLAHAQAKHYPSGYSLNLRNDVDMGKNPPYVAALYTDDSRPIIDRLFLLGHAECRAWLDEMDEQARTLWRELGFDIDPAGDPAAPVPCQVKRWRDKWRLQDSSDGSPPVLAHASGFAVQFKYGDVKYDHDDGAPRQGWLATEPEACRDAIAEVKAKSTDSQVKRALQEAAILWQEIGYFDGMPDPTPVKPFGDDWRSLWKIQEEEAEQWLVHVSGHTVQPVYGIVEDDGTKAWTLYAEDFALDWAMRDTVGTKAWRRVEDQAWQLCKELGYTALPESEA